MKCDLKTQAPAIVHPANHPFAKGMVAGKAARDSFVHAIDTGYRTVTRQPLLDRPMKDVESGIVEGHHSVKGGTAYAASVYGMAVTGGVLGLLGAGASMLYFGIEALIPGPPFQERNLGVGVGCLVGYVLGGEVAGFIVGAGVGALVGGCVCLPCLACPE